MNRIVLLLMCGLAALGLVVAAAGPANAAATFPTYTNYHFSSSLICNDCHSMHGSQQHDYSGTVSAATFTNTYRLLKGASAQADVTTFCLTCHDGQGGSSAPDVLGTTAQTPPRGAGGLNNGTADSGTYHTYDGHTLTGTAVTAPGGGPSVALTCTSCHGPHGTANYRNLHNTNISGGGQFSGKTVRAKLADGLGAGTETITGQAADVLIEGASRPAYSAAAAFYDANKIYYTTEGSNVYAGWCGSCHPDFVNTTTSGTGKHPTGNAMGPTGSVASKAQYGNAGTKVPVLASQLGTTRNPGTGFLVADTAGVIQPSCVSCHKSHGNTNAFGLLYVVSGSALGEAGGGSYTTQTCQVCHPQGQ